MRPDRPLAKDLTRCRKHVTPWPAPRTTSGSATSTDSGDRIAGWKSIGAYFGRDRTTAIRWARERALPVHRMPGDKTRHGLRATT